MVRRGVAGGGWLLLRMLSGCTGGFLAAPPKHPALAPLVRVLPHRAAPGAGQASRCCLGFHKRFFFLLLRFQISLMSERGRRL